MSTMKTDGRLFFGGIRDLSTVTDLSARLTSILAPLGATSTPLQPVIDTLTNDLKGFAYADITMNSDAALDNDAILTKAIKSLHGLQWRGSKLRVERAVENGLDKLSRERKEEAENKIASEQAEQIQPSVTSLPQKLRIRKRGYEPCIEVFSTPFESNEIAEAEEAQRILNLPPSKMAKELEKKVRHRAVRIHFADDGKQDSLTKHHAPQESTKTEKHDINVDESKKRVWEERVGRSKLSAETEINRDASLFLKKEANANKSLVDGHDDIRSSMLLDARRQLSILSSLLGETDLAEPEYFTRKETSKKDDVIIESNGNGTTTLFDSIPSQKRMKTHKDEQNKSDSTNLSTTVESTADTKATLTAPVMAPAAGQLSGSVQVNIPSWRSFIYGEKLAQAGRTQISLADAKANLVVNSTKDPSQQQIVTDEQEEESKVGPIGKFLSVYKSTVPLHVDPSFTFSFGSEESNDGKGEVGDEGAALIDANSTGSIASSKGAGVNSTSAPSDEEIKKPKETIMNPAERWLSHRPETKRKKEEGKAINVEDKSTLFPGTTTFTNHQQGQRQGHSSLGNKHTGMMKQPAPIATASGGASLPLSSFSSLLSKAGSFFGGNSAANSLTAAKEILKKDFRAKQRQSHN
jgi:hypothetical protein